MQALEPPDSHFLSAAVGWMELGNPVEAKAELDRITEPFQNHPLVLEVRWAICAEEKDWSAALGVANALVRTVPDAASGWLNRAFSIRRAPGGGLRAAWTALLPALEKFPAEATIPYNLSCYACQMRDLETARRMLRRALELEQSLKPIKEKLKFRDGILIKEMALKDPDLEPLWEEIRGF